LNPHVPLPFPPDISRRGYAPVEHPGIEPGDTAVSERPLQPAGSCSKRGRWRCRASRPAKAATGVQSPLPRRRRTFHRGTRRSRPPLLSQPAAFGAVPATRRVLVPESAPRPGVNRQGMEEDGRLERHCYHSRPVSGRGQSPDWFIFRGERVTRTPRR